MVAAHSSDPAAAAVAGLRATFIARPADHGAGKEGHAASVLTDHSAKNLAELARVPGASPHFAIY